MRHRSFFTLYAPNTIRWVLGVFLLIQFGYFLLGWLYLGPLAIGPWTMRVQPDDLSIAAVQALPNLQRWLAALLASLSLGFLFYAAFRLHRMLQCVEQGTVFSHQTLSHWRAFSGAILLSVLVAILQLPLREIFFRLFWGSSPNQLKLIIGSQDLQLVLVCGVFYLIAAMMQEGQRLAEENAGFV
jgi:Protein of unknown function (DUF2975)